MTVAGYIFKEDENCNIEEQRSAIEQYSVSLGLRIDHIYIEKAVLKQPFAERSEGRRIVKLLQSGDSIICCNVKWVLASARDGLRLITSLRNKEISLYCVDVGENLSMPAERKLVVSEGGAELVKKLLGALAACESSKHGDSIRTAKQQMKKEGKYLGGPVPLGWKVKDGFLIKDAEQQKIIASIRKLRTERWSYRDIAKKLNDHYNVQLSHEGIRKIVRANQDKR